MTREELIRNLKYTMEKHKNDKVNTFDTNISVMCKEVVFSPGYNVGYLEQEPKMEQFAKWVATEIFDDMWEYNKDSFAEIACRKLAKLGIVRAKGDEWELVEPQESEVEHGKMNLDEYGNLEEPCLSCDKVYMEILSYEWWCDEKECPYMAKRSDGE